MRVLGGPGGSFGVPLGPSGETRDAFGTPVGSILGRSVTKKCGTRHVFIKSFCYRFFGCIFTTLRACLGLRRHPKQRFRMGGVVKIKVSLFFKGTSKHSPKSVEKGIEIAPKSLLGGTWRTLGGHLESTCSPEGEQEFSRGALRAKLSQNARVSALSGRLKA